MPTQVSDDGGLAFPSAPEGYEPAHGMTLRDWFAGQALAGILANEGVGRTVDTKLADAMHAYRMADAMLAARKEPKA